MIVLASMISPAATIAAASSGVVSITMSIAGHATVRAVTTVLIATDADALLIDLSDVPFMDSAGLGALIGGIRRTRENGGEVAVACSRASLTRLLHTTGFDRIVPVAESVDEAAKALSDAQRA